MLGFFAFLCVFAVKGWLEDYEFYMSEASSSGACVRNSVLRIIQAFSWSTF